MNKKNLLVSVFTVFVQYYDYHLYGFLAASIAKHFFPSDSNIIQLLNTYLIMTIAMVAKPAGAIIFGRIGDLKGRSNSFRISLLGTAIASLIISITPSYQSIGIASVIILLLCRMLICAFVSSGSDGVRLYIYEHIAPQKQCLGVGITTLFTQAGSLIASLSAWFFTAAHLPDYSWRLTFLIGSLLGFIVIIIMRVTNFSDTNDISKHNSFMIYKDSKVKEIILDNRRLFIICVFLAGCIGSTNQFLIIFFGTYNFEILGIAERAVMHKYISIAIMLYMISSIAGGYAADRFGRAVVAYIAIFCVIIFTIIISYKTYYLIFDSTIFLLIAGIMPFITIPAAVIFKESIPTTIRYRIFSLSHAVGSVIISAPTALISTFLYHKTRISWLPFIYFILTVLMIFWCIKELKKYIIRYD